MKIIGATVGTMLPKPNFDQTDPKKGDYIKGDRSFLQVDDTLTKAGISADAKAVGDAITELENEINGIVIPTIEDIDAICGTTIQVASKSEVLF